MKNPIHTVCPSVRDLHARFAAREFVEGFLTRHAETDPERDFMCEVLANDVGQIHDYEDANVTMHASAERFGLAGPVMEGREMYCDRHCGTVGPTGRECPKCMGVFDSFVDQTNETDENMNAIFCALKGEFETARKALDLPDYFGMLDDALSIAGIAFTDMSYRNDENASLGYYDNDTSDGWQCYCAGWNRRTEHDGLDAYVFAFVKDGVMDWNNTMETRDPADIVKVLALFGAERV